MPKHAGENIGFRSLVRMGALSAMLLMLPSAAVGGDLPPLIGESSEAHDGRDQPFEGGWVPEESIDACAPIREEHAEGDFVIIRDGRLITGAEFGCEIFETEARSSDTFHLELECGGSNRHFGGEQSVRIVVESHDRLIMQFDGEDPATFSRCRP